jgi:hypothetical protein
LKIIFKHNQKDGEGGVLGKLKNKKAKIGLLLCFRAMIKPPEVVQRNEQMKKVHKRCFFFFYSFRGLMESWIVWSRLIFEKLRAEDWAWRRETI